MVRYCAERRHEPIARLDARPATATPRRVEPTKPLAGSRLREAIFKATPAAGSGKPSNEYRRLQRRDFKEYSLGHQKMYTVPIELLKNVTAKYRILDVGFGIGFGLERMLEAGIVESYVGVEPVADSFAYVREKFGSLPNIRLVNDDWLTVSETNLEPADYVFCIEVVEHLPEQVVGPFLRKLARFTKRALFLSTPDCERSSHGTRTERQWIGALSAAGLKEQLNGTGLILLE